MKAFILILALALTGITEAATSLVPAGTALNYNVYRDTATKALAGFGGSATGLTPAAPGYVAPLAMNTAGQAAITLTAATTWAAQPLTCPAQPCFCIMQQMTGGQSAMMYWIGRSTAVPLFGGFPLPVSGTANAIQVPVAPGDVLLWRGDGVATGLMLNRY